MMDFVAWPKTPRLFRDMLVTEKLDGTNAAVIIEEIPNPRPDILVEGRTSISLYGSDKYTPIALSAHDNHMMVLVGAQSRKRLITPEADNFGFAKWVFDNAQALYDVLGPGRHYGEWWGSGIQRGYGMSQKLFSLFNVNRYAPLLEGKVEDGAVLRTVPVLYQGAFDLEAVGDILEDLRRFGSKAAPEFMNPEGVVVFHEAAGQVFKATLDNDGLPKSQVEAA